MYDVHHARDLRLSDWHLRFYCASFITRSNSFSIDGSI